MPAKARSFEIYRRVVPVTLVALFLLLVTALGSAQETEQTPGTAIYYLLRHGEKADNSADPPLSPEGPKDRPLTKI